MLADVSLWKNLHPCKCTSIYSTLHSTHIHFICLTATTNLNSPITCKHICLLAVGGSQSTWRKPPNAWEHENLKERPQLGSSQESPCCESTVLTSAPSCCLVRCSKIPCIIFHQIPIFYSSMQNSLLLQDVCLFFSLFLTCIVCFGNPNNISFGFKSGLY